MPPAATVLPQLHATPWALPGAIFFVIVAAVTARPAARRLHTHWLAAVATILAFGATLVGTVTPSPDAGMGRHRFASLAVPVSAFHHLTSLNQNSENILLFIPLALLVSVAPRRLQQAGAMLGLAIVLPFVIEAIQWAVPSLGRSGFQLTDAVQNELGVAIGAIIGGAARGVLYPWRRVTTAQRSSATTQRRSSSHSSEPTKAITHRSRMIQT